MYIYIYIYRALIKFQLINFSPPLLINFNLIFRTIPHIRFDGGLDKEPGKAELKLG